MSQPGVSDQRPPFANYIDGEWRTSDSGETYEKRGPWQPDSPIGSFPASGSADVDAAVAAATAAFSGWSQLPAAQRGALLMKAADALETRVEALAQDMTLEMGKPIREARGEAARAASILRYFAGEGWRPVGEIFEQSATRNPIYTLRRPIGVVGLITPWNFPIAIPTWKAAPALAYGNTVVLKLAQDAPLTGLHLAAALHEAGIPAGVFNVVVGRGSTVGTPLVRHPDVQAVSFTGSVATGKGIRELGTSLDKRVQLELGGHNPLIVMADADLDRAVEAAFAGAYWSAGQKCTATRRMFVQEPAYERFRERLLERIGSGRVGDPTDPSTEVGPIVSRTQFDEVLAAVDRGSNEGGTILAGGNVAHESAYLLEPTLFEDVRDENFLSCEEVFGPVSSLYPFSDIEEAIRRANAVPFGLSASIFTQNIRHAQQFSAELEAGLLHVNSQTAGADIHVPFGGIKGSGWGPHEQGRAALEFYSESVTVYYEA